MAKKKNKGKKKTIIIIVCVIAVIVIAALLFAPKKGPGNAGAAGRYTEVRAERRNITKELTGSGTLRPADSYTVTTLVEGEILSANFEEGDIVQKDTVLYSIDPEDASNNIERAEMTLEQAKKNYDNTVARQYVKADVTGTVAELTVAVGDEVRSGQTVGTVRDSSVMILRLPFFAADAESISAGDPVQVILDGSFEIVEGTVKMVSTAETIGTGNIRTRNVTIEVKNNGGLSNTLLATAEIKGAGSVTSARLEYKAEGTLVTSVAGTVSGISKPEGSAVSKEDIILTLTGKDVDDMLKSARDSLRTSEMSAENTIDQLDNYTIKSPIDGTVIDKTYKQGDKVTAGRTMCIIYDLSYLEMTLNIDELDISNVAVGQRAIVTADAVSGRTYEGVVTKVSVAGTTANSTTVYPVTVRIDETEGLLPGMNADVRIVGENADNVIAVPNSAIARGNVVLVTCDSPSAANAIEREAPEGYVYVRVEIGLSDDNFTQITSGITEGDTVAYIQKRAQGNSFADMMNFGGGSPQGGMGPGGGSYGGSRGAGR